METRNKVAATLLQWKTYESPDTRHISQVFKKDLHQKLGSRQDWPHQDGEVEISPLLHEQVATTQTKPAVPLGLLQVHREGASDIHGNSCTPLPLPVNVSVGGNPCHHRRQGW